ncbi:unnamed protein product, partial [marine sediment metagenome]
PAKTAMQSGKAKTESWMLEFEPEQPRKVEPLMGYTSSRDMKSQIRLSFETKEEAIAYAQKNGIAYSVQEPKETRRRVVSYSENFRPYPIKRCACQHSGRSAIWIEFWRTPQKHRQGKRKGKEQQPGQGKLPW